MKVNDIMASSKKSGDRITSASRESDEEQVPSWLKAKKRKARVLSDSDSEDDLKCTPKKDSRTTTEKPSTSTSTQLQVTTPVTTEKSKSGAKTVTSKHSVTTNDDDDEEDDVDQEGKYQKKGLPNMTLKPQNRGLKEIPEGAPYCLLGLTFVISGVLDSLSRDDCNDLVKKYGGHVTNTVSSETSYLIVGDEPGKRKVRKAVQLNVPQISEDDLLDLFRKSKKPQGNTPVLKSFEEMYVDSPEAELKKERKVYSKPEKKEEEYINFSKPLGGWTLAIAPSTIVPTDDGQAVKVAKVEKPVDNKEKDLRPPAQAEASSLPINIEFKDGKFHCPLCSTNSTRKSYITSHYKSIHLGQKFKCDQCPQEFLHKPSLTAHIKSAHLNLNIKFICPTCGEDFTRKWNLQRHINDTHLHLVKPEKPKVELVYFPCEFENCDRKYMYKSTLKRHVKLEHTDLGPDESYKCDDCDAEFVSKVDFKLHVRTQHPKFKHPCPQCPMVYKSNMGFRHHKLTVHYDGDIFRCHCSKVFTEQARLDKHKLNHQNDIPQKCEECDRSFPSKRDLTTHKLVMHEGYSSHGRKCNVCDVELANHPSLLFHMKVAHGGQDMKLNLDHTCVRTKEDEDEFVRLRSHDDLDDEDKMMCCKTKFKNEKALRIHMGLCHKRIYWWPNLVKHKLTNMGRRKEEVSAKFLELYDLAESYLRESDLYRKLYLLVFVPYGVTEDTLDDYLADPENEYFFYWGKRKLDGRYEYVSPHHSSKFCKVSTHYLAKIKEMKAFHVADILLDPSCVEAGKGEEAIAYMEAKEILRIVMFSIMWKKLRAFQKLELHPFSGKITKEEVQEIYDDVVQSEGQWNRLKNTRVDFKRWTPIETEHITTNDTESLKCSICQLQTVSSLHLCLHKFECHNDNFVAKTPTDRIVALDPLQPHELFEIIRDTPQHHFFHVYVVFKVNEDLQWSLETYQEMDKLDLESYVGKNTRGTALSAYHFKEGKQSTLKNMKTFGFNLIHVMNYECESKEQMEKLELIQILIGVIRREAWVGGGPLMRNRYWTLKFLPQYIQREEMKKLVEFSFTRKDQFFENPFAPIPIVIGTLVDIPSNDGSKQNEGDANDYDEQLENEQLDYEELDDEQLDDERLDDEECDD